MAKTRTETDSFGPIEVDGRPILGRADRALAAELPHRRASACRSPLIRALALVKKAAARGQPRRSACSTPALPTRSRARRDEVIDGKHDDEFPLVVWQTG